MSPTYWRAHFLLLPFLRVTFMRLILFITVFWLANTIRSLKYSWRMSHSWEILGTCWCFSPKKLIYALLGILPAGWFSSKWNSPSILAQGSPKVFLSEFQDSCFCLPQAIVQQIREDHNIGQQSLPSWAPRDWMTMGEFLQQGARPLYPI